MRARGDWMGWIEFFAQGLRHTAEEALATRGAITRLKARTDDSDLPKNPARLLGLLYEHPIVDAKAVMRHLNLGFDAASDALKKLHGEGWIEKITGKRRGRTYRFTRYLEILEAAGGHEPGLETRLSRP